MIRRYQEGDTIIEVVLAFAIFTFAAMGTLALINSGLATTQRNLEITQVRQQIDSQAELLRYARDTDGALWQSLISHTVANPLSLGESCQPASGSSQRFYLWPNKGAMPDTTTLIRSAITSANYRESATYAKIDYAGAAAQSEGIWIEATAAATRPGAPRAYDFYIHACWDSIGLDTPMTLGTIVRIYE